MKNLFFDYFFSESSFRKFFSVKNFTKSICAALMMAVSFTGNTQQVLNQDFETGTVANAVTASPVSWATNGAGNGTFLISNTALTYTNYNGGSGKSLAVVKATSGTSNVGPTIGVANATTSFIYYSFILNVASGTNGATDYFAMLSTSISSGSYFARLHVKTNGAGYSLGIDKVGGGVYKATPTVLSLNTNYLVVVRYDYANGSSTNDNVYLWINPTISAEPATASAEISVAATGSDASAWTTSGVFTLRNSTTTPTYKIDGIKVAYATTSATAWTNLAAYCTNSVAPTSASASVSSACGAVGNSTLSISGGTAGTAATLKWYSGSCGGTLVGTGNNLSVAVPASTTTYYARYENGCNNTTCASTTITISPLTAPTGSGNTVSGCSGTTTITASGATSYSWWSDATGGTNLQTGSSYTTPTIATTTNYYVEAISPSGTQTTLGSGTAVTAGAIGSAYAFNVTNNTTNPLFISQLGLRFNSAATYSVKAYYRIGTYSGFEGSSAGWTNIFNNSIAVTASGVPIVFDVTDVAIPAGSTYGIYIYTSGDGTYLPAANASDANITISGGSRTSVVTDAFTGGTTTTGSVFAGSVLYKTIGCSSSRTTVTATVNTTEPVTQASAITFSSVAGIGMTVGWTNGSGLSRVVIMNTTNSFTDPTDGTTPTANAVYGGSGEQVIYNGAGTSVAVSGLDPSTTYYYRVYEANCTGSSTKYNVTTATNNPNSQSTTSCAAPTTQASSVAFANILPEQMDVSWTIGNGSKTVIIMNTSNSFTNPTDGTDPSANAAYAGSGQQVVYNGTGTSVTVTGLVAGTTYHFRAYSANCSGGNVKFYTVTATNNPNNQATLGITVYYNKSSGSAALQTLSNWGTSTDGTGTAPSSFTANYQRFYIMNGTTASLGALWTVSGTLSKVILGDPTKAAITFTAGFAFTGTIDIPAASSASNTLVISTATIPTFGTLDNTSTVNYALAGNQTVTATTYGNLTFSGTSGIKTFAGTVTSTGTLTISGANTVLFNSANVVKSHYFNNLTMSAGIIDGGSLDVTVGSSTSVAYFTGNFNKTGGTISNTSATDLHSFVFNGGITQQFTLNTLANTYTYTPTTVTNNTTLVLNTAFPITGVNGTQLTIDAGSTVNAGTYIISQGTSTTTGCVINGKFITANTAGFTGNASTTSILLTGTQTITLGSSSEIEYNGTLAQVVTARTDYANVTISNNSVKTAGGIMTLSGNMTINSTATFAGSTFTHNVAGNWTNNGGTFTGGTSTINFNSTAADQAINGTAASQTFNNITVTKTGKILSVGGSTTSLTAAAFTITAGTFTAPTTLNISGNFANSGTFTHNSGTATFNGGAAQTLNAGSSSFNNVSITNTVTGVSLLTNNLTVAGTFTLNGAGGFNANALTNTVTGAATLTSGIYTANTAAQTFNGGLTVNGGTLTGVSGTAGSITTTSLTHSSGTISAPGSTGTFNVTGNWSLTSGATFTHNSGTVTFNGTSTVSGTGATSFNNVTINSTKTLTGMAGATGMNVSGNWSNSGTYTHNSGTVTFNGGAAQTLNSGGSSFNNVSITNTVGAVSLLTNNLTVAGAFTLNGAGGFNANALTNTVTGAATLTSGTYTANTAEQTFNGGLTVNGGTLTGVSGTVGTITTTSLTQSSGTINAPSSSGTFNVSGDWTRTGGSFVHNSGRVTFTGSNSATISGASSTTFNTITVNKGSSVSTVLESTGPMSMASTASGALALTNGLLKLTHASASVNQGTTLSIASTSGIEINGGTLNGGGGTVTNNGLFKVTSGSATVGTGTGNSLSNAASSTFTVTSGTLNVAGRLTFIGSTANISGGTITVCTGGNASSTLASFDMDATTNFTMSNGTVVFQLPASAFDLYVVSGGTKNISGGTFQIGNASTTASAVFEVYSEIPLFNLTVNSTNAPKAQLTGNITISNNLTINGGTYDANGFTSTITNLVTVPTGATYLASSATQTLSAGLTVSGGTFTGAAGTVTTTNVTLSLGTLTAPSGTFNVSGNWTRSGSPTFNHNSGTVVFNGTDQSITGSNAFYSFNKTVTSGATLTLPSSATQTFAVGGTLTLQGDANNLLKIVSSTPGTQALINPSGTRVIDYVDAKDNNNANGTVITATNSYDAGNLTNWAFSAANLVWTGATNTNWNTITNWAAGYLPNATDNVTITKTGANQLVLETSPTVNNITISENNTVSLVSNTLTVKGTWLNNGTLTPGTSTVAFAGTTGTQTVNNGANSFYNVTHTGASTLQSLTNAMTIGGTFTNSAGTFDANSLGNTFTGAITVSGGTLNASSATQTFTGDVTLSGGTYTAGSNSQTFNGGLTVSGGTFTGSSGAVTTTNLTMTSGTLTAPSGAFNVSGNWATTGGTYTPGSNTVTFTKSSGTQTVNNSQTGFYNLVHSGAGTLQLVTNHMTVTNDITNSNGTLDLNGRNLTIGGNYSNSVGSDGFGNYGLLPGVGSVIFNKSSGTQTLLMTTGDDFSNIQHTGAGTLQLSSDLAMTGNLTSSAGTFDVNGYNIVIGGNWTNSATFLPGTGATYVALNGSSGTQTIDNGSSQFNDLQVIGTAVVTMTTPAQSFGDVTVNGPLSSTAQLVLVGGDAQSITSTYYMGGTPIPFQSLTINKTAGVAVTLTKPVRVTGTLTMTQGDVVTDATNILEVGTSASSVGSVTWTAGTVRGPMKRWFAAGTNSTPASGIFPVGGNISTTNPWTGVAKGVMNRYAQVNFTTAPSTGGYIIAKYVVGNPGLTTGLPIWTPTQYIQNFEEEGYWDITPYSADGVAYASMNSTPYTLKLRLNMPSTNDGSYITAPERLRIISSKGPAHNTWVVAGTQGAGQSQTSTGDYLLEETGVTGFSWFNGGGDNNNPLPIELINFSANYSEDVILINWQTASEYNTSHFNLEKSINGIDWIIIHTEQASGNSTQLVSYNFTDKNIFSGVNYYRLNQYDLDGVYEQFGPISISYLKIDGGYFSIFPNPSSSSFSVMLNNDLLIGESNVLITNELGKEVYNKSIKVEPGINLYSIDKLDISAGVYYISVINSYYTSGVLKQIIR